MGVWMGGRRCARPRGPVRARRARGGLRLCRPHAAPHHAQHLRCRHRLATSATRLQLRRRFARRPRWRSSAAASCSHGSISTRSRGAQLRPQPPRLFDAVVVVVVDALRRHGLSASRRWQCERGGAHAAVMERTRALAAGEYSDLATGKLRARVIERARRGALAHGQSSLHLPHILHPIPPALPHSRPPHTTTHTYVLCRSASLRGRCPYRDAPASEGACDLPTFVDIGDTFSSGALGEDTIIERLREDVETLVTWGKGCRAPSTARFFPASRSRCG